MPEINIAPWVRFTLYLVAAVALQFSAYLVEKVLPWWSGAEDNLVGGLASLLFLVAAAKVDLRKSGPTDRVDP